MTILRKRSKRDHHAVAKGSEMGSVFHFFGENVARVDTARNMENLGSIILMTFSDLILAKVDMFDSFRGSRRRPVNTSLIVIVNRSAVIGTKKTQVLSSKFERLKICDAFVGSVDFGFT